MKLRYSLRAILLLTTVACVILAHKMQSAHERRSAIHAIKALNGGYSYSVKGPSWLRKLIGDEELFYSLGRVSFGQSGSSGEGDIAAFDDESLAEAVFHMTSFPAIRDLGLSFCSVTDQGLEQLAPLENLSDVNLGGCPGISDAGLDVLAGLKSLKRVNVQATAVTAEGVSRFQQHRPDCKVIWDNNPK